MFGFNPNMKIQNQGRANAIDLSNTPLQTRGFLSSLPWFHQIEKEGRNGGGEWSSWRSSQEESNGMNKRRRSQVVREKTVAMSDRCRVPRCLSEIHSRGLCRSHYQQTWRYVADGTVSWEELEDSGKVAERERSFKSWLLGKRGA